MKRALFTAVALLSAFGGSSFAQSFVVGRMGLKADGPTYHLVEVFQQRGKWIYPDVGYIDFGDPRQYREVFVGGGAELFKSKHFTVIEEVYLDFATGSLSDGALYFFPSTYLGFRLTPKLGGEVAYSTYLPLNKAGTIQYIIERAKVEYSAGIIKFGVGYGAYQVEGSSWQDKPFITATLKTKRFGDIELWFQRLSKNTNQLQIRYFKQL